MFFRMASALRRGLAMAVERPRAGLWTSLALVCALAAAAVAAIAAFSVSRWTAAGNAGEPSARMVIYLQEGRAAEAPPLVAELRTLPGVRAVELVGPEETAKRLVAALGPETALLEGVELQSLPSSVEVTLAAGVRDVVAMSPTMRALHGKTPGVSDIVVEEERRDHASGALSAIRTIAWSALALFSGLALIVVLAAIRVRLDRDAARREIEVAQLLGAGPGFVVVPTALAGAIHGAIAALVATVLVLLGVHVYGGAIAEALAPSFGTSPSALEVLAPAAGDLLLFVVIGGAVGLIGGLLAGASRVAK